MIGRVISGEAYMFSVEFTGWRLFLTCDMEYSERLYQVVKC